MGQTEAHKSDISFLSTLDAGSFWNLLEDWVFLGQELVHLDLHLVESSGSDQKFRHFHLLLINYAVLLFGENRRRLLV